MRIFFTQSAFRQFRKLPRNIQKRIDEKLHFYLLQKNPLQFAEPLRDYRFGNWKFRIGDYRALFEKMVSTLVFCGENGVDSGFLNMKSDCRLWGILAQF